MVVMLLCLFPCGNPSGNFIKQCDAVKLVEFFGSTFMEYEYGVLNLNFLGILMTASSIESLFSSELGFLVE